VPISGIRLSDWLHREVAKRATIVDQCSLKPVTGIACELPHDGVVLPQQHLRPRG
jgi:hypothetical protein